MLKQFFNGFFSYKGRLNVSQIWTLGSLCLLFGFGYKVLLEGVQNQIYGSSQTLPFYWYIGVPVFWISLYAIAIRRFHDLGKNGWYVLFSFVPLVNIYFAFQLFFVKGANESNKWGGSPEKGFI